MNKRISLALTLLITIDALIFVIVINILMINDGAILATILFDVIIPPLWLLGIISMWKEGEEK
jgi:hypothetical protein